MIEISNAEFEVLEALWQNYPASANDIIAKLNEGINTSTHGTDDKNKESFNSFVSIFFQSRSVMDACSMLR